MKTFLMHSVIVLVLTLMISPASSLAQKPRKPKDICLLLQSLGVPIPPIVLKTRICRVR